MAPRAPRVAWQPVLVLAGYLLLVPPAFVLGPLAGLLLLSRPRTWREWIWIAVAISASMAWLSRPGDLAGQVVRAAAVLGIGAYMALTLWRPAKGWGRAIEAVTLGGVGLAFLISWIAVDGQQLQQAVAHGFRVNGVRLLGQVLPAELRGQMPALTDYLAVLFPALLALVATIGIQLAWTWHCLLAERPVGERLCTGELNS